MYITKFSNSTIEGFPKIVTLSVDFTCISFIRVGSVTSKHHLPFLFFTLSPFLVGLGTKDAGKSENREIKRNLKAQDLKKQGNFTRCTFSFPPLLLSISLRSLHSRWLQSIHSVLQTEFYPVYQL